MSWRQVEKAGGTRCLEVFRGEVDVDAVFVVLEVVVNTLLLKQVA